MTAVDPNLAARVRAWADSEHGRATMDAYRDEARALAEAHRAALAQIPQPINPTERPEGE